MFKVLPVVGEVNVLGFVFSIVPPGIFILPLRVYAVSRAKGQDQLRQKKMHSSVLEAK